MDTPKLAVWPFVLMALILTGLSWLTTWAVGWWSWATPWMAALNALAALLLVSVVCALAWVFFNKRAKNRPSEAKLAEQQQLRYQQRLLASNFEKVWQQQCRREGGPYDCPWYLLVNAQLDSDRAMLVQMGFEAVSDESVGANHPQPISFWISDTAVLVGVHTDHDPEQFNPGLELLLKLLKSKRPRQAANGVLIGLRASQLLACSQDELEATAKQQRLLVRHINQSLGLNLPIYTVLTEMVELMDFCQCFSNFDDQRLEEPLGAMMPVAKTIGYDPSWFLSSFDELQKKLAVQISPALKAQLNPEYRNSILVGTYQFSLLRAELESYFQQLFLDNQFEDRPLNFRGYFFTNAAGQGAPVDRLTMLLASELGFSTLPEPELAHIGRSLFVKKLLSRAIAAESQLVGVNRRRELLYGLLRIGYSGGLCLLFGLFLWLMKVNFDYTQTLDNRAVQALDNYKQHLLENPPKRDDLAASIQSLSGLRNISRIHRIEKPWYILSWLPNPGIDQAVDQAYQRELEDVLLISMRDYLLKDLYVYNKLEDKVKTLELFNLQQILYNAQRNNTDALVTYYVSSLQEEGEGDVTTLERFRGLLQDLLKSGVAPPVDDAPLIELVKASLESEDLSDLLYQHILQQPKFSRRVDMRKKLGQNYAEVLQFKDGFSGYLVPYIFTREGFQELMKGTGFQLADQAIEEYEGVIGRISGQTELSRLNRQLKQQYIEDYIDYWQRFAEALQWHSADGWGPVRQQLALVTDPVFSPVKRFYQLLSEQTDLNSILAVDPATAAAGKPIKVKGKLGKVAKKAQGPLQAQQAKEEQQLLAERRQSAQKMVDAIAKPFVLYQQLVKLDDTGQSRLDLAINQLTKTEEWVNQAVLSKNRGSFFLDQLAAAETVSPLTQMQILAQSYDLPVVRELLTVSAEQVNQLALDDIRKLLNKHWNRDVMDYYSNQIRAFYPFTSGVQLEVSLKAFKEFFGPKGVMDKFGDSYISYFNARDNNYPVLNSFLPGRFLAVDDSYWEAMEQAGRIQAAFFNADKVGFHFAIRAQMMSTGVTEFSLRSERPLYVYRNGPSLWTTMNWPAQDTQSRELEFQLKGVDSILKQQSYSGIWNWFRIAEAMDGTLLQESTTSSLVAWDGEQSVQLLLRVEGDTNPFVAGFFKNLALPETI